MSDLLAKLKEPFHPNQIHWRVGATSGDKSKGIALAYLNARDVMKRLDDVVGLERWQTRYPYAGCCELSVKCIDEWITKTNSAGETQVEGEKGQASDAFKRAAVLFGVGRYLYYLPNQWVALTPKGNSYALAELPNLPVWALPQDPDMSHIVAPILKHIANKDSLGIGEIWAELSEEETQFLWKAKTKGGYFDSEQKAYIRNCTAQTNGEVK